jgi:hypothetical protein
MINQRIQYLIDKEYLEEDPQVKGKYTYIP